VKLALLQALWIWWLPQELLKSLSFNLLYWCEIKALLSHVVQLRRDENFETLGCLEYFLRYCHQH
jgi:hypothetical protein